MNIHPLEQILLLATHDEEYTIESVVNKVNGIIHKHNIKYTNKDQWYNDIIKGLINEHTNTIP
jgi:hypothetical protein